MTLNESIGRFCVRKTLRFEMKPVGKTVDALGAFLEDDERRAASLNVVKAMIEAEHLSLVRRVFKALPDPLPDAPAIKEAFKSDPEYGILTDRNAKAAVRTLVERCRCNRWPVPKQLADLSDWPSLFVKWHWHCCESYKSTDKAALVRTWAGRAKADVEMPRLPRKRKASRNRWFDHGPFRLMFDNRTCGMSWLKEDFGVSRNFLLTDGERVLIGIVPRRSRFDPFALPRPSPAEPAYRLYEETAGEKPLFRDVSRALVDAAADHGGVCLFELVGRGLRNRSNLNAMYLRALFSAANLDDPAFRLAKSCEFYARKAAEIPLDGKPDHFRQRFTETKFFVTLHVVCNPQLVARGTRPAPYGNLTAFVEGNPYAKFVRVAPTTGGYLVGDAFLPTAVARSGGIAGLLARLAVERDAYVLFDPAVSKEIRRSVLDKFEYVVVRGRDPFADGGVMRGYQLVDRLFVGCLETAQAEIRRAAEKRAADAARLEAERSAKAAEKAAKKAYAAEKMRQADERRELREKVMSGASAAVFDTPIFQTGSCLFRFGYKTSDNVRHEVCCRAETRDEVYQKLRTVGVRPYRVECLDHEV